MVSCHRLIHSAAWEANLSIILRRAIILPTDEKKKQCVSELVLIIPLQLKQPKRFSEWETKSSENKKQSC